MIRCIGHKILPSESWLFKTSVVQWGNNWGSRNYTNLFSDQEGQAINKQQGEVGVCQLCALWVSLLWFIAPLSTPYSLLPLRCLCSSPSALIAYDTSNISRISRLGWSVLEAGLLLLHRKSILLFVSFHCTSDLLAGPGHVAIFGLLRAATSNLFLYFFLALSRLQLLLLLLWTSMGQQCSAEVFLVVVVLLA